MAHICMVEDNESIREAVTGYLQLADHEVSGFATLASTRVFLKEHNPDLILLDIMLPDGDGFIFAKELSGGQSIPIIFMSARISESDRITGFEIGADDYIVKPFSTKELVLRVAAVLKRTSLPVTRSRRRCWILDGHELVTNEDSHKAILDRTLIKLTLTEWKILLFLSSNGGAVFTREQILNHCREYSFEGYHRTVDTHVKNLRSKLVLPGWIETVRGYGYRFVGTSV